MSKIIKDSLPKQISDRIEAEIKEGKYKIGDKLPTEQELIKIFDVSRNTIREAMQSLTNSGILETRQGNGTYVVAQERLEVDFFNVMNSTTTKDVLEVRNLLEQYIVTSAIENVNDKDIEEIRKCLETRKKELNSVRENTEADLNFHFAIAKATHNELIVHLYKYVSKYFSKYIYEEIYNLKEEQNKIDELHEDLYIAIKNRDGNEAHNIINQIIKFN